MLNRTFSSVAVVLALGIVTPMQVNAFGLGKLELSSALNEPFKAKIPVTALREDEEGNLQVRLATSNEFTRAGIERSYYLTKLVFNVVEHSGGATIEVSSQQPIKEPFIDFLLTATTGGGRLIREYTVLLDPPKAVFVRPASKATPEQVKKPAQQASKKTTYRNSDSGYQAPETNYYSGNSYGPTKRDDTLWDIALATKPLSTVSVHQMMMALLDANPNAFIRNNINNLKTGYTLTIPSIDEISKLSNRQAVAQVAEQYRQWKNANKRVVAAQTQAESNSAENNGQLSGSSDGQTDTSSDARLQLVVDSDEATMGSDKLSPLGNDALTKLRDQLTLAQETIEGQEQENIDFKARMDAMEEQLDIMRRIIMVKDADLARLQGALGDDQKVELGSNDLSDEMQKTLQETELDDSIVNEDADAEIDALVDSAGEILDEGSEGLVEEAKDLVDNSAVPMQAQSGKMFDETAVESAAAAAKAEAEYSGNYIFAGADPVSAVLPEKIATASASPQDPLQPATMIDKAAVAAAAESARAEAEFAGNKLFSEAEMVVPSEGMDDSFDEMSETPDEMNVASDEAKEIISSPEADIVEEIAVEDANPLGLVDKIKAIIVENKIAVLGGLGALFLGLLAWLFARRRNQDEEYEWVDTDSMDDTTDSEVESPNIGANIEDENEEQVNDESSEILIDPEVNIDDLLKQAEMSIAYGEYEEAHAVVEQARLQDPTNQAVALKLVALAYHQKQSEEFNKLTVDIDIDKDSAEWQEIVAWGKELESGNELLPLVENVTEETVLTDDLTNTLDDLEPEAVEKSDSVLEFNLDESLVEDDAVQDQIEEISKDEEALSFDTDFNLESGSNSNNSDNDNDLDLDAPLSFDIESDDIPELTADSDSVEDAVELELDSSDELTEVSSETDALLDINLDEIATDTNDEDIPELMTETIVEDVEDVEDVEGVEGVEGVEEIEVLDSDADDLEFDIGDFDEVDEAETKLDLAAAYVDMGDPDGAKNILNEVLQEGNDEQKSRAQDLLNNLK